jgi:hypothetical protein
MENVFDIAERHSGALVRRKIKSGGRAAPSNEKQSPCAVSQFTTASAIPGTGRYIRTAHPTRGNREAMLAIIAVRVSKNMRELPDVIADILFHDFFGIGRRNGRAASIDTWPEVIDSNRPKVLNVPSDGRIRRIRSVHNYADEPRDNICFSKFFNINNTDTCQSEKIRP